MLKLQAGLLNECAISEKGQKTARWKHADEACFAWEDVKFCHTSQHETRGFSNKKEKTPVFLKLVCRCNFFINSNIIVQKKMMKESNFRSRTAILTPGKACI